MSQGKWQIPGYTEVKELGAGSQGRVVLARHNTTGQHIAVKYLATELLGDAHAVAVFRAEAHLLKRVVDPHVTRLLDYVETSLGPAILMEAVSGHPLRKVLDQHKAALVPEVALNVLKGSLLGLAAAHATGVVHRDYKPANVLVQSDGQSKLIDFGVAVLTGQAGIAGTPSYMAPEQWEGQPASPATDLYAATCVFVECITGAKPYQGTTVESLQKQHMTAPMPLDRLPEPLRPLVARGLAKNPGGRIWDATKFVEELEAVAAQTYGPDWERRGLIALGTLTAALSVAFPTALIGAAALTPGVSATNAGAGAASAGQGIASLESGHTAMIAGKGALAKVGGAKGATAIGGTSAAAIMAGALLWPSSPQVGGEAQGSVHASFAQPGALLSQPNMPASETPYISLGIKVAPARVKPGTAVRVTIEFRARMPQGVKYLPGGSRQCFGEKPKRTDVNKGYGFALGTENGPESGKDRDRIYFFPPPSADKRPFPSGPGLSIAVDKAVTGEDQPYNASACAFLSRWTDTRTFTMPSKKTVRPGRYRISVFSPLKFTSIRRVGAEVPPTTVGANVQGSLPVVTVLEN
ncbi:serine/threonine protein kinase [Spirillospora sp. NPDC127200]